MLELFNNLEFRHPALVAFALTAIPVYLLARRSPGSVVFSSLAALPTAARSIRSRLVWIPPVFLALAAAAAGIALAGPQVPDPNSRVTHEGIAIMMVIDISGSMQALDLSTDDEELTRLDAVKLVFNSFVQGGDGLRGRPDDAIGIVSFAGYADTRCPLTLDHSNVQLVARELEIVSDRSEDGTAMGDGLALAVERLRESDAESRVAILLTDGVNNTGEEAPLAAAQLAVAQGVRVYTIGAGTNGVAPVRVTNPRTGRSSIQPMAVEIDEETLEEIAERTGGRYFRATDSDSLREIYREIDRLERTEMVQERFLNYDEYFSHAMAIALALMSLAWLARGTIFRRLP